MNEIQPLDTRKDSKESEFFQNIVFLSIFCTDYNYIF